MREETGLDVRVIGFLGIWLDQYPRAGGRREANPQRFLPCRCQRDRWRFPPQPAEVVEAAFFRFVTATRTAGVPRPRSGRARGVEAGDDAGRLETALPDGPQAGAHAGYVKTGGIS